MRKYDFKNLSDSSSISLLFQRCTKLDHAAPLIARCAQLMETRFHNAFYVELDVVSMSNLKSVLTLNFTYIFRVEVTVSHSMKSASGTMSNQC